MSEQRRSAQPRISGPQLVALIGLEAGPHFRVQILYTSPGDTGETLLYIFRTYERDFRALSPRNKNWASKKIMWVRVYGNECECVSRAWQVIVQVLPTTDEGSVMVKDDPLFLMWTLNINWYCNDYLNLFTLLSIFNCI